MRTRNTMTSIFGSNRSIQNRRSRRGTTLAEVSIMSVLALMISSVTVGLMYETGLAIKNIHAETRTRSTRMIALDQVRYQLGGAVVDTVQVLNASHTITFANRKKGWNAVARFDFVPSTQTLLFDDDISDNVASRVVARGPIDLTFELDSQLGAGVVRINVRSAADVSFGDVDTQDGETAIFLRNT